MIKQKFNKAFTLAEGAAHAETFNNCRKTAFTLAEVLIVLVILGVVSALVLPLLLNSVSDRLNTERDVNIAHKFTEAMEDMRLTGKLVRYNSTEEFVDELQKHMKIVKRCDADHIAECWPTDKIATSKADKYVDVSSLKTRNTLVGVGGAKNLTGTQGLDEYKYDVDVNLDRNVGLILADGASVILTYDKNAKPMGIGAGIVEYEKNLPVFKLGRILKTKSYVYSSNVTNSIDYITDTNGKQHPNRYGELDERIRDIRSFRRARLANQLDCETGMPGVCKLGSTYSAVDCNNSEAHLKNMSPQKLEDFYYNYNLYCGPTPSGYNIDYWAGARKACDDAGMYLPSIDQVIDIYNNKGNSSTPISKIFRLLGRNMCVASSNTQHSNNFGAYQYKCINSSGNENVPDKSSRGYILCIGY